MFGFVFRHRGKPSKQEPSEHEPDHGTDYETVYEVHHRTSRIGQAGIDAARHRANFGSHGFISDPRDDTDGRDNESVLRHRLATCVADYGLTSTDEQLRH